MEMKSILRRSHKAQLMTILVLVLFMLMLAELFAFALLNVNSNSMAQQLTVSLSTNNYGSLLKQSAGAFAQASMYGALAAITNYEYSPALRKGNFIANFSQYMSYLMTNGILPNDVSGYPQNAMGNLTLASYNASISKLVGFASQNVIVNETAPRIFQTDPFHLRVSYTENIAINASGSIYRYSIPVNASINLNNTPDLFYAQQGILRTVKFASASNLTSVVSGSYATSGNTIDYAYGTVYAISSSSTSSATCSGGYVAGMPSQFNSALANSLIISTYNALSLSSCITSYGGLVSYIAPSSLPAMPYLTYSSSSGVVASLPTGMHVLLYGPGMDVLNIENLRNAVMNANYFPSQFTPSFIDRANANFADQSPNGIFSFNNYNTQIASFNGASSFVDVPYNSVIEGMTSNIAVSAWVSTASSSAQVIFSAWDGTNGYQLYSNSGNVILWSNGGGSLVSPKRVNDGNWHYIVGVYTSSMKYLYVDGVLVASGSGTLSASTKDAQIGTQCSGSGGTTCSDFFSNSIANVQLYGLPLTAAQVQQIYQEGISGLPIANAGLVGWWPLNGNANDFSGNSNNGVPNYVTYRLPSNYARDSILVANTPMAPQPLPGILSCTSNSQCASNSLPMLYLSYMPLAVQSGIMQSGGFNGWTNYISVSSSALDTGSAVTMVVWSDQLGSGNQGTRGIMFSQYSTYLDVCYSGAPLFAVENLGGTQILAQGGTCPTAGVWRQYVGTYDGSTMRLYINGVQVGSNSQSGTLGPAAVNIGEYYAGSYNFNGLLSNVQLYNAALSATQVSSLYQEGIAGIPLTANLVGWWPLNGNANDYSGNGNSGVPVNGVIYPYFSGTYNAPGLSSIATTANEWQALGLANT